MSFWKRAKPTLEPLSQNLGQLVVAGYILLHVTDIHFEDGRLFFTAVGPGMGKLEKDFHRCILYAPDGSVVMDYRVELEWETSGGGTATVVQPVSISFSHGGHDGQTSIW
jgi:hypothetical protein